MYIYNSHATLNALAYIVCVKQFVMSLPAISLGDWFSVSRKGGTGEVGWYIHPKDFQHGCVWVWLKKSLSRVIVKMVMENSHFISQGLYARSVQVQFIC